MRHLISASLFVLSLWATLARANETKAQAELTAFSGNPVTFYKLPGGKVRPAKAILASRPARLLFTEMNGEGCPGTDIYEIAATNAANPKILPKRKVPCVLDLYLRDGVPWMTYKQGERILISPVSTEVNDHNYPVRVPLGWIERTKFDMQDSDPARTLDLTQMGALAFRYQADKLFDAILFDAKSANLSYYHASLERGHYEELPSVDALKWESTKLENPRSIKFQFDGSSHLYGVINQTGFDGMARFKVWDIDATGKNAPAVLAEMGSDSPYVDRNAIWANRATDEYSARNVKNWTTTDFGAIFVDGTSALGEYAVAAYYSPYLPRLVRIPSIDGSEISGISYAAPGGIILTNSDRQEFSYLGTTPPKGWPQSTTAPKAGMTTREEYLEKKKNEEKK
jgi:hypothetical protein